MTETELGWSVVDYSRNISAWEEELNMIHESSAPLLRLQKTLSCTIAEVGDYNLSCTIAEVGDCNLSCTIAEVGKTIISPALLLRLVRLWSLLHHAEVCDYNLSSTLLRLKKTTKW